MIFMPLELQNQSSTKLNQMTEAIISIIFALFKTDILFSVKGIAIYMTYFSYFTPSLSKQKNILNTVKNKAMKDL